MNSTKTASVSSSSKSPLRSIREKCIDCCAGNKAEVVRCQITVVFCGHFEWAAIQIEAVSGGSPGAFYLKIAHETA